METCFNVGLGEAAPLGQERAATLAWLLAETYEPERLTAAPRLSGNGVIEVSAVGGVGLGVVGGGLGEEAVRWAGGARPAQTPDPHPTPQVGPRLSFQSAWSTNAVNVCASCGLAPPVGRLERSARYDVTLDGGARMTDAQKAAFAALVHDRMTEQARG